MLKGHETMMQFESLANELFLEIFKCLTTAHIYHAFHGLNSRFGALILEYFRNCDIDFRSISKFDFDTISHQYLTQMINQITSLCLSDDDDTPGQVEQFFSHGFILRQFDNLRSLFLSNIRSETVMDKIMFDLSHLSNLTHLTFEQCYFPLRMNPQKAISFANCIWNLPKLVSCCFTVKYKYRQSHHFFENSRRDNGIFITPTVTSSTLECLSFVGLEQCDIIMDQLFAHTPRLRRLTVDKCSSTHINLSTTVLSMTSLFISLSSFRAQGDFCDFLQTMPNLCHLKVEFDSMYLFINGRKWEQIICNSLPKLKRLQFKMLISMCQEGEEQVDHMLDTYRSQFWLVKHRWFVQCDWSPGKDHASLYTLPYAFDSFHVYSPIISKSTSPYENDQRSYDCVHSLMYKPRIFYMPSLSHIQCCNVEHLSIEFPINPHFWSLVPTLDRLISLDALSNNHDDNCQYQLQDLLDRAPRLSSIRICWKTLTSSLKQLFQSRHLSVYQLELFCYGRSLNREQCMTLSNIIPGIHCKVLNLVVADRTCILTLVKTIPHLQALNIRCQNDKWKKCCKSTPDELCEWLQEQLSSSFFSGKISQQDNVIRLWIC